LYECENVDNIWGGGSSGTKSAEENKKMMDLIGRKQQEVVENCIMKSFIRGRISKQATNGYKP
jgi:hypothetical protein